MRYISEETKRKIGDAQRGSKNHRFGKHNSKEHNKKISEANKGRIKSEETRRKISESKTGKKRGPQSEEWRAKISAGNKGRVVSEETRKKLSEANKGQIPWSKGLTMENNSSLRSMAEKHRGVSHSPESNRKSSEARRGQKRTPEMKKRMSEGVKLAFAKHPEIRIRLNELSKQRFIDNPDLRKYYSELAKNDENINRLHRLIKPSKIQLKLFEIIKINYPNNIVESEYKLPETKFSIDVAIPELKLGFEYDEPYWHKDKEKDKHRHDKIESLGWNLTHYINESEFPKT